MKADIETFEAPNRKAWRDWLKKNHDSRTSIWLLYHKKDAGIPSITYPEAVEEALCFGWIDSTRRSAGKNSSIQLFTRRKPKSVWSKINKERVKKLAASGLMTPAGLKSISIAKKNGSWTILNDVEKDMIPADLDAALSRKKGAKDFFLSLSKSGRKMILQWLRLAKRSATREKRILTIAENAAMKLKPKQFR